MTLWVTKRPIDEYSKEDENPRPLAADTKSLFRWGELSRNGKERLMGRLPSCNVYKTRHEGFMVLGALEKKFINTFEIPRNQRFQRRSIQ